MLEKVSPNALLYAIIQDRFKIPLTPEISAFLKFVRYEKYSHRKVSVTDIDECCNGRKKFREDQEQPFVLRHYGIAEFSNLDVQDPKKGHSIRLTVRPLRQINLIWFKLYI